MKGEHKVFVLPLSFSSCQFPTSFSSFPQRWVILSSYSFHSVFPSFSLLFLHFKFRKDDDDSFGVVTLLGGASLQKSLRSRLKRPASAYTPAPASFWHLVAAPRCNYFSLVLPVVTFCVGNWDSAESFQLFPCTKRESSWSFWEWAISK